MLAALLNWLDSRTSFRALRAHLLDEPLPPGTGWAFTTGSVVTLLIGSQFLTGVGLAMYYVPSPSLAYDSVRFLMSEIQLGWLLRALHFWGASFVVVAAVVHLVRVFLYGAYKAPRELTWITGLVMLLLLLGFSLSGYLLPWDQKAYWATTVTISVARGSPLIGDHLANILRGGADLGALTLGRWYAAHVFLLPAALAVFVVAHVALMRKHGIAGPLTPQAGPAVVFYPWHVIKDTVMMASVFALLMIGGGLLSGAPRRDRQSRRRQLRPQARVVLPVALSVAEVLFRGHSSWLPRRWCRASSWAGCSRFRFWTEDPTDIRGPRRDASSPWHCSWSAQELRL